MLFNSFQFALFLPVVFLLYWFVFSKNAKLQNAFIIAASYFFYAYWDWKFLFLIAFVSICTWGSGLLIERSRESSKKAKFFCGANIVVLLGVLGVFKYYDFFAREFASAFLGGNADGLLLKIILPAGISFYTFSALSYTIDLYRGNVKIAKNPLTIFAYLSFFPQLLAGPIGRASELIPQYETKRTFEYGSAVDGVRQMLWGFFKKMVIADNCAFSVNTIWNDYSSYGGSTLLFAAILYTVQIYCDFSGYSDMAIGCAKLFGIKLRQNFLFPYFSRNVAEFWRRWHISLNTWFRDYLYIPLGGSREGMAKTIRNTMIIFAVCGFWHGANWTFIVWGIFHGLLFIPLLLTKSNKKKTTDIVAQNSVFPSIKETCQMSGTFILVTIGWVFFRAPTIHDATNFLSIIFSKSLFTMPSLDTGKKVALFIVFFVIIEWWRRKNPGHVLEVMPKQIWLRALIYFSIGLFILQFEGISSEFIYFKF